MILEENLLERTQGMQYYYPGVWTAREKPHMEKMLADFQALRDRGPIDVERLISGTLPPDTPGVGVTLTVTEDMMLENAKIYDPENPLYNDRAYAEKSRFGGLIAYPTISCHDDTYVVGFPAAARDAFLVSGLDHTNVFHKPVYAGDTLYYVVDDHHFYDMTPPEGDYFRTLCLTHKGSVYNQRGELVSEVIWRMGESAKCYLEPPLQPENPQPVPPPMLEVHRKPDHHYTDQDYDYIKSIWAQERRQGAEPLYWEDVQVGDRPAPTLDGPTLNGHSPSHGAPIGTGVGGVPSLKRELLDPEIAKTLLRDETSGVYYPPDLKAARFGFSGVNLVTRDYAIHHINNWMGEQGWLKSISWSLRNWDESYGPILPDHPEAQHWLGQIPELGRTTSCGFPVKFEIYLIRSQVVKKYVQDGKFYVDLVLWHTSITKDIIMEGCATVELPSRR
jgi:acyl dehydratase